MKPRGTFRRPLSLLALATALAATASPVVAQSLPGAPVVTDIVADFDPGRDFGTTVASSAGTHTIDGGTLTGANLFHSFASFSLAQGETARWVQSTGDPASIAHVINRVTGGGTSFLSGTLDSTAIPNADFWFVNPSGIIFGAGAQVNVPAAAHFSTASSLGLADGSRFEIATPGGSTLSVTPPESFGFVGGESDILLDMTGRIGSPGLLTLTAANIGLQGSSLLTSGLTFAAVGENGGTVLRDGSADRPLSGQLILIGADANTIASARGSGALAVNAGAVRLTGSQFGVFSLDGTPGGDLSINAATVDLLDTSKLVASSSVGAAGDSGDIRVVATARIGIFDSSVQADAQGSGDGGDVLIAAPDISLANSQFAALTFAAGDGGNFIVRGVDTLTAVNSSFFNSSLGTGATGDILIHGGTVSLTGLFVGAQPSTIGGAGQVRGGVGDVRIVADGDLVVTGATITTETFGAGDAGDVRIAAGTIALTNVNISTSTTNFFDSGPPGDAGLVDIAATGSVTLDTVNVSAAAEALCIDICSSGNAGSISLGGIDISVFDSTFRSEVFGNGNAGAIAFTAAGALVVSGSDLRSNAFADDAALVQGGSAGSITLAGGAVSLSGSEVSASTFSGDGGLVNVFASGLLIVADSNLSSDTFGSGTAGGVSLSASSIAISDFSRLSSDSFGSGTAGGVVLAADKIAIDTAFLSSDSGSTGAAGSIVLIARTATIADAFLTSQSLDAGRAGNISLLIGSPGNPGSLAITDSTLSSDAVGFGDAGNLFVAVEGRLDIAADSRLTSSTESSGNAGTISLGASEAIAVDSSQIASRSTGQGLAGFIGLSAPQIDLTRGSVVTTSSTLTGVRGFISIDVDRLTVDASSISSNTARGFKTDGTYGLILIGGFSASEAERFVLRNGSAVQTNTNGPGDGGDIQITTQRLDLGDSMIQAESMACTDGCASVGPAGSITIATDVLTLSGSDPEHPTAITSNTATNGMAGRIGIVGTGNGPSSLTLTGSQATISSQSSSTGNAGSIEIVIDRVEIAGGGAITTSTGENASGQGGSILVTAKDTLTVRDGGKIVADSNFTCPTFDCGDQGKGGTITVTAGSLNLIGSDVRGATYIRADSNGTADAGQISIDVAKDFAVRRRAYVSSDSTGAGDSGGVALSVGNALTLTDSFISANALDQGTGGNVRVSARTIDLDNSYIASDAFGAGDSGVVDVTAGTIALRDSSYISSDALGSGSSFMARVTASGALTLDDSYISADVSGGNGGDVFVKAGTLRLSNRSYISSDVLDFGDFSSELDGNAGNVNVQVAGSLELSASRITSNTDSGTTGRSGEVFVSARDIRLLSGSAITSNPKGDGDAQLVEVFAGSTLALDQGSRIASDAFGLGNAGFVFVDAPDIRLTQRSYISSDTIGDGNANNVDIGTNRLSLTDGSYVSSDSLGQGDGGSVFIDKGEFAGASDLTISSGSSISTNALGDGIAGVIELSLRSATLNRGTIESQSKSSVGGLLILNFSDILKLENQSKIQTNSSGPGNAGAIGVTARAISLSGQSAISSDATATSTGESGLIDILANDLLAVSENSAISTGSANNKSAGLIIVEAGEIHLIGSGIPNTPGAPPANARITSSNTGTGSAGQIAITQTTPGIGSGITLSEGALITTTSNTNAGLITIDMAPGTILRLEGRSANSRIDTSILGMSTATPDADNGRVTIGGTSAPYAVILNGGSILALGQPDPAKLTINTRFLIRSADRENRIAVGQNQEVDNQFEDVSSGTVATNLDVVDASSVLSGSCPAARASGQYSQFARPLVGPYAVETQPAAALPPVSLSQTGTALASLGGIRGCR